jgi:hypothetical protein
MARLISKAGGKLSRIRWEQASSRKWRLTEEVALSTRQNGTYTAILMNINPRCSIQSCQILPQSIDALSSVPRPSSSFPAEYSRIGDCPRPVTAITITSRQTAAGHFELIISNLRERMASWSFRNVVLVFGPRKYAWSCEMIAELATVNKQLLVDACPAGFHVGFWLGISVSHQSLRKSA